MQGAERGGQAVKARPQHIAPQAKAGTAAKARHDAAAGERTLVIGKAQRVAGGAGTRRRPLTGDQLADQCGHRHHGDQRAVIPLGQHVP